MPAGIVNEPLLQGKGLFVGSPPFESIGSHVFFHRCKGIHDYSNSLMKLVRVLGLELVPWKPRFRFDRSHMREDTCLSPFHCYCKYHNICPGDFPFYHQEAIRMTSFFPSSFQTRSLGCLRSRHHKFGGTLYELLIPDKG